MTNKMGDLIRQDLAEQPDGVLEMIAEKRDVSMQAVLDCLSSDVASRVAGSLFEEIWGDLTSWGQITFVVYTADGFFECEGAISPGEFGHGYFNVHGDSPIGGHLRMDRCRYIYFVDRPYFGTRSCSLRFINEEGGVMFTIYVGYNKDHTLKADQLARFESLRQKAR
ncbi:heme utilization cystosolic carrier protein HutX [Microvirga brassicacearum]|nr:heme utilization cystosolic carrier protein HutX [Microvirga brassicacearum]